METNNKILIVRLETGMIQMVLIINVYAAHKRHNNHPICYGPSQDMVVEEEKI